MMDDVMMQCSALNFVAVIFSLHKDSIIQKHRAFGEIFQFGQTKLLGKDNALNYFLFYLCSMQILFCNHCQVAQKRSSQSFTINLMLFCDNQVLELQALFIAMLSANEIISTLNSMSFTLSQGSHQQMSHTLDIVEIGTVHQVFLLIKIKSI